MLLSIACRFLHSWVISGSLLILMHLRASAANATHGCPFLNSANGLHQTLACEQKAQEVNDESRTLHL